MADTLFSKVPSPTARPDVSRGLTDTGTNVRTTLSTDSPGEQKVPEAVGDGSQDDVVERPSRLLRTALMSSTDVDAQP